MKIKKATIFLNGNLSQSLLKKEDINNSFIIAADGAATKTLSIGIIPDYLIGDMDSIDEKSLKKLKNEKTKIARYPKEKDMTDGQLAVEKAVELGAKEIYIFGLLGDRIDHLTCNLLYIAKISKKIKVKIFEHNQTISFVSEKTSLNGDKGEEVSLIPMLEDCQNVSTKNLYYQLKNEDLEIGSTRGISNIFTGKRATIHIEKGTLMVVHSHSSADSIL